MTKWREPRMRIFGRFLFAAIAIVVSVVLSSAAFAQGKDVAAKAAGDKEDKSGTNPVNLQDEIRIYNEYSWLNTKGDGNQNLATFEFRTPFAGGKWAFRLRADYNSFSADSDNDGNDDVNEAGIGDFDMRFLTVLALKGKNAFAVALEVFLNTASDPALGSGTTSLGPQAFYARFFRGGFGPYQGGLFAPGVQWKYGVHEAAGRSKTRQILVDLNFLMMGKSKKHWFFTDPQIIRNLQTNKEFAIVDIEFGKMLKRKGHSVYVRPAIGVGADRPTDGGVELGYKMVGFGS